jgi:hypothetical protein
MEKAIEFSELNSISQSLGANGCPGGGIGYNLSIDQAIKFSDSDSCKCFHL